MAEQVQHPGNILGRFIEYLLTQKGQAAKHLGISRATLFRVLAEEGRITVDIAMRLEQAFHIPAAYWLQRQADFDIAQAKSSGQYRDITPMKSVIDARDALAMAECSARGDAWSNNQRRSAVA